LAFLFAAQYFFIRRLTALRAAADIPRRLREDFAATLAAGRPRPRLVDDLFRPFISSDEIAVRTP
jgi:hypothetical protein